MRHSMRMLVKDTRSQDGKDDKNNDKGSKSRSQSMKEQTYNKEQRERPRPHELNNESNLIDLMKEIIVVNLDSSSDNNNSDSYSTSQISTSEEIDYDSPEPPKSLLKWYHYLSDEYKDNGRFWGSKSGCNESDVKPSWKDIEKAKACMLAKAQASEASSKAKVEACGSKVKVEACGSKAKLQASTKTLIVKSPGRGSLEVDSDVNLLYDVMYFEIIEISSDSSEDRKGASKATAPIFYGPSTQGLLDAYGYNTIEEYLSWNYFPSTDNESTDMETTNKRNTNKDCIVDSNSAMSKGKYVPVCKKHKPNMYSPVPVIGSVLGLANVTTWDEIEKKMGARKSKTYVDKAKGKRKVSLREAHVDYIRITKEYADTLSDIVEQARTSNPLDNALAYACMYTKQIQELLVYVSDTCPSSPLKSEKLVAVTPMNKARKVTFAKTSTTLDNNTQIQVDVHQTQTTSKPLVPSTNEKCSINASRLKTRSETKNHRIMQPLSSNQKSQKIEAHTRNAKPSLTKEDMNDHARAKVVKSIKMKEWKPTGKMFKNVGYKWVPTGRTFTIVGTKCPLTRFTSTKIVPPRIPVKSTVITNKKPSSASQWRPKETNNASSISAPKIVESMTANHLEPNNHMTQQSYGIQCFYFSMLFKCTMQVIQIVPCSPSSTTVDQDAPSPSNSQTRPETQSPVILNDVEEDNHDLDVAHMNNDPFFVEPKNYKDALTQACWIEAMQEELNEFERLEVWKLVPRPDKVMVITLKWIYKVKLDELGGFLKNKARLVACGYRQEDRIDFKESFAPMARLDDI
ncbi:retrovirus-related pol polyprotein from transposon TNT 1-94 [Tanacetum coccineum]